MYASCASILGMSLFMVISSDRLTDASESGTPASVRPAVIAASEHLLRTTDNDLGANSVARDMQELVGQLRCDPAPEPSTDWWRCQQMKLCVAALSERQRWETPRLPAVQTALWQVSIGRGFLRGTVPVAGHATGEHVSAVGRQTSVPPSDLLRILDQWERELLAQLADELCGRLAKP